MSCCPVKVSVIVPVYNVEKYLSTCLNSCITQTLYDIEIICVNDGSTDHSRDILEVYAQKDYRIQIIDKPNGGLSSARNAGMKAANGSIIMFLDSDDSLDVRACERVWIEMLEAPTDIVIFGANAFPQKPAPDNWLRNTLSIRTHRVWEFKPEVLFSESGAKPFVWRQAFTKEFLDKAKLEFDENVKFGEDMVFQLEAFPQAKHFAFIEDRLYNYRWYRQGSLMSNVNKDKDKKIGMHLYMVDAISEYWLKKGWIEKYGLAYLEWLLEFIVVDIRSVECLHKDEHIAKLKDVVNRYGLEKYMNSVSRINRPFVNMLK